MPTKQQTKAPSVFSVSNTPHSGNVFTECAFCRCFIVLDGAVGNGPWYVLLGGALVAVGFFFFFSLLVLICLDQRMLDFFFFFFFIEFKYLTRRHTDRSIGTRGGRRQQRWCDQAMLIQNIPAIMSLTYTQTLHQVHYWRGQSGQRCVVSVWSFACLSVFNLLRPILILIWHKMWLYIQGNMIAPGLCCK